MNQKNFTIAFLFIGILFAGLNFYIFNQINNGSLNFDFDLIRDRQGAAQAKAVLPDIKPGESYTKSKLRDEEIAKIKNSLPYSDNRFSIIYDENTKYLSANIKAKNLTEYRENKFLAEEKLLEIGSREICLLEVVWAVPIPIKSSLESADLTTRGCAN